MQRLQSSKVACRAVTFAWSHRAEFFKIETFGDMHAAVCAVFSVVLFLAARCGDVLKPWTQGATKEDLAKAATKEDLDRIDKKQSEQMDNTEEQLLRRLDNLTEKVQAKTDLLDQVVVALAFRSINTVPTNCRPRFRL